MIFFKVCEEFPEFNSTLTFYSNSFAYANHMKNTLRKIRQLSQKVKLFSTNAKLQKMLGY